MKKKALLIFLFTLLFTGAACNDGIRVAPPVVPPPAPLNPAYFEEGFKSKYRGTCESDLALLLGRIKTAATKIEEISLSKTPFNFSGLRCQAQVFIPDFDLNGYVLIFENADALVKIDNEEIYPKYGHKLRSNYAQDSNALFLIDNDSVWGDSPKEVPEGLLVLQEAFTGKQAKRE